MLSCGEHEISYIIYNLRATSSHDSNKSISQSDELC